MKRIVIVLCLFLGCSPIKKVETYGLASVSNLHKVVDIDPSNFEVFNELISRVEEVVCNDSIPALSFELNNNKYIVGLANTCPVNIVCGYRRNSMSITNGFIVAPYEQSLDSLSSIMEEFYFNPMKKPRMSETPLKGYVKISYTKSHRNILSVLEKVVLAHSSLNLNYRLVLLLERIVPPPPLKG